MKKLLPESNGIIDLMEKERLSNIEEMKSYGYKFTEDGYYLVNEHNISIQNRALLSYLKQNLK